MAKISDDSVKKVVTTPNFNDYNSVMKVTMLMKLRISSNTCSSHNTRLERSMPPTSTRHRQGLVPGGLIGDSKHRQGLMYSIAVHSSVGRS